MKKKHIITIALAATLALSSSFCSLAGEWKQDTTGWHYQNTDGSYLSGGWHWINGKSYYFDSNSYCLTATTTPDGYTVDGSGAWTINGVVQTRETEASILNTKVIIPNGYDYIKDDTAHSVTLRERDGSDHAILVMAIQEDGIDEVRSELGESALGMVSDEVVKGLAEEMNGKMTQVSSSAKTFATGSWNYYSYTGLTNENVSFPVEFYTNFVGSEIRIVVIVSGTGREFATGDAFVQDCIR